MSSRLLRQLSDVEEHHVAVDILITGQVVQGWRWGGHQRLGQAGLRRLGIQGKVENSGTPASPSRSATSGRSRRPLVAM